MTDENKPLNYRTLSELYAAYNSGVAFELRDREGTYPETYPVTGMSLTEDAAGLYVFAKTSTFPHVPWSVFLPDGSLEDHSFLHLRHSPEPTQPVTEPAQAVTAKQSPHPEYDKGFSDGWNRCEERQAAAPASQPFAYEFSRSNGDGTHSEHIERGRLQEVAPGRWEHSGLPRGALADKPIKALYTTPQTQPAAVPASGPVGFDHKTAANFLNGKTVTDEEVRQFVAHSRWAHDDRDWLRNTTADLRREIAQRDSEIALLKTSLLDAEARQPLTDEQIEALPAWSHFVGLWPESRKEIVRAIEAAHAIAAQQGDAA